jgi:uncharacterized protein YbaR (Trm112 family)
VWRTIVVVVAVLGCSSGSKPREPTPPPEPAAEATPPVTPDEGSGADEPVIPAGIEPELVPVLACPENGTSVRFATRRELTAINARIAAHTLRRWGGSLVDAPVTAVLIREDAKIGYEVDDSVPDMIIADALVLDPSVGPPDPKQHRYH